MVELTQQHDELEQLTGSWTGESRIYLQPGELSSKGKSTAEINTILDGSFIQITYDHVIENEKFDGVMILGYHTVHHKYEMSWIDQYHMGTGIMYLEGDDPQKIEVKGNYAAGNEVWAWAISINTGDDTIDIIHHNIHPSGESHIGVQTTYKKKKQ